MTLKSVSVLVLATACLAACGSGGSKKTYVPNEFEVVDRAPLAVPPESTLTPPRPGEPRAQTINPGRIAFDALFPGKKFPRQVPKSQSENQLLSQLPYADVDIRSNAGGPLTQDVVKKKLLLADLLEAEERTFRPDNVEVNRVSTGG